MSTAGKTRPQLTTIELQQLRWLLGGVLGLVSVCTLFYLDVQAWILVGLSLAGIAAVIVKPALPGLIPQWAHRLAFPLVVAVFVGDLWVSGEVLPAMVRLDLLLLLYRGITYRQKRDDLQVLVLGLFLIVVAGVLTVSLTFAVQILAFVACALAFLLVITLTDGADTKIAIGNAGKCPAWAVQVNWFELAGRVRRAVDWRVGTFGAVLFVALVAVSALLFLAIPRFQLENSFFLERFISKKAKTGFSDTIRFGDVTDIQQDNSVALTVDVSDRTRIPASPYWRMLVLDEYREGTFRLSAQLRRSSFSAEQSRLTVTGPTRVKAADALVWTFYLESGVSRFLPLLGPFQTLRFQELQNWRTAPALGIVALRSEPATMTAYRVEGMESGSATRDNEFAGRFRAGGAAGGPHGSTLLRLALAEPDRAIVEKAVREIDGGAKLSAVEFGKSASAWLRQRHAYSLQPSIPAGDGDPVVRWMAATGGGHCELFAGSLVVLARTAGIPARVVTGFRGGSWNAYSNNFTLRNSDAHAWCELFDLPSASWIRVDPTPGASTTTGDENQGEGTLTRRLDRSWTARLDSLRVFWYRRIVNFDQQSQLDTLRSVKHATENSGKRMREALESTVADIKSWVLAPWGGRRVFSLIAVVALLAGGIWALRTLPIPAFGGLLKPRWWHSQNARERAGMWLRRMAQRQETAEAVAVVARLKRLRYGPNVPLPDALRVFDEARRLSKRLVRKSVKKS
jgi:hypothetical protein